MNATSNPIVVPMTVAESTQQVKLDVVASVESFALGLATAIQVVTGEHYAGSVEFTPSAEEQVIHTEGLFVDDPITIKAIPNNYGLITWDGSAITVS